VKYIDAEDLSEGDETNCSVWFSHAIWTDSQVVSAGQKTHIVPTMHCTAPRLPTLNSLSKYSFCSVTMLIRVCKQKAFQTNVDMFRISHHNRFGVFGSSSSVWDNSTLCIGIYHSTWICTVALFLRIKSLIFKTKSIWPQVYVLPREQYCQRKEKNFPAAF